MENSMEAISLILVGGDNYLAAKLVVDPMLRTESFHRQLPETAVFCLERAGLVIDAGMENSRVSPCLVLGKFLFFLDNHNGLPGKIFAQSKSCG
jgi:hypothetical protein